MELTVQVPKLTLIKTLESVTFCDRLLPVREGRSGQD